MRDVDDRPRRLLIKTVSDDSKNVQLIVGDSGIDPASNAAERLFESFYTTKNDGMANTKVSIHTFVSYCVCRHPSSNDIFSDMPEQTDHCVDVVVGNFDLGNTLLPNDELCAAFGSSR
jgi:hypothetical protein